MIVLSSSPLSSPSWQRLKVSFSAPERNNTSQTHLRLLGSLLPTRQTPRIAIRSVPVLPKLDAPPLDDSPQTLDEDGLDLGVQLGDPRVEVGVPLEVELVDSLLNRAEEVGEGDGGVGAGGELVDRPSRLGVHVDEAVGAVLEDGDDAGELADVETVLPAMAIEPGAGEVGELVVARVERADEVLPADGHTC